MGKNNPQKLGQTQKRLKRNNLKKKGKRLKRRWGRFQLEDHELSHSEIGENITKVTRGLNQNGGRDELKSGND